MSTAQALCSNKASELRFTYPELSVSTLSGTSDLQNQNETRQINDWHQLSLTLCHFDHSKMVSRYYTTTSSFRVKMVLMLNDILKLYVSTGPPFNETEWLKNS